MAQLTDQEGALAAAYRYDAFGNTTVQDYIGNITGNKKITENYTRNPYTYNGEYTDASTGNQYLRARYYSPETGNFFTEDSYLGSLLEPLERNLYTYAENDPVNYRDPSGHGIKSKLKNAWGKVKSTASKAWNKVKSTASKAWSSVKKTASNIYNKARTGLNNYMNSNTYKSYSDNAKSSGGGSRTGASTGNGYVGRNSGGGAKGNTSYSYVRYNRKPSYKLAIGRTTRYYHTEAERNTVRKVCETAERIKKGEKVVTPNPTAAAILAGLVATTVVFLTGGAAAAAAGAMGLEGFGAAVATTTITGTVGGATEAGLYSALMGNDANTVTEDAIKGGIFGGAIGAVTGGMGYKLASLTNQGMVNVEPEIFSPIKKGPLKDSVANSFNGATYTKYVLKEDTIMYRVYGGKSEKIGSYLSRTPQEGGLQSQLDLALLPEWGNTAERLTEVVVPKGTIVYEGTAAPQNILDSKGNIIGTLSGGGNQIYIPEVKEWWFK